METGTDKARVAFLPFPARVLLDVASFYGLDAGDRFDEVSLCAGAFLGATQNLPAQNWCTEKRNTGKKWHHKQGNQRKRDAVEKHDAHINH